MGEAEEIARRMFDLFDQRDLEHLLPIVDDGIELRPRGMPRQVYRGHDGMRQLLLEAVAAGREATVTIDRCVENGPFVAVLGRIRVRQRQFMADSTAAWLLEVRLGRVRRSVSYRSHANALRAAGAETAPA